MTSHGSLGFAEQLVDTDRDVAAGTLHDAIGVKQQGIADVEPTGDEWPVRLRSHAEKHTVRFDEMPSSARCLKMHSRQVTGRADRVLAVTQVDDQLDRTRETFIVILL